MRSTASTASRSCCTAGTRTRQRTRSRAPSSTATASRPAPETRARVAAFADVDPKKVGTDYQFFEHRVPVVHFAAAAPPFVLCVALDRTDGAFEANLASLKLTEGVDYFHFC